MAGSKPQQSFVPLNQAAQGGIIDDIDVLIADAAFVQWDYNGNIDHEVLALGIQFQDDNGKTYDQYYSAGELTYFVPSDDGAGVVPVADKQLLNDNTNAMKFLMSLLEVGFPEETLATGNVKELVGTKIHVKQQAQPVRQGLIRGGKNADRTPTVLLASALISLPGQEAPAPAKKAPAGKVPGAQAAKPAAGAGAKPAGGLGKSAAPASKAAVGGKANGAAGKSTPAPSAAGDDGLKDTALEILTGIIVANDGAVTKKDLSKLAFQAAGEKVTAGELDAKSKTKVVQMIFQDANLHAWANDGAIVYDGAQVSLPE